MFDPIQPGNQVVGVPGLDEGQSGPTGVQFDLADPVTRFGLTIIGWGNAATELSIETFLGGNPVDNLTIAMPPSPLSGSSDDQIFFGLSNPDSSFDRVRLVSDTPAPRQGRGTARSRRTTARHRCRDRST